MSDMKAEVYRDRQGRWCWTVLTWDDDGYMTKLVDQGREQSWADAMQKVT